MTLLPATFLWIPSQGYQLEKVAFLTVEYGEPVGYRSGLNDNNQMGGHFIPSEVLLILLRCQDINKHVMTMVITMLLRTLVGEVIF